MKCSTCLGGGKLYRNNKFKEPHGYPYRPPVIDCYNCNGKGEIAEK